MNKSYTTIIDKENTSEVLEVFYADLTDDQLIELAGMNHEGAVEEYIKRKESADKAAEPELVKVYRNAIDQAIATLNEMPDNGEGLIEVPWPTTARPKIDTERWADAPLRTFRIDELTATQPFVKRETIVWHLEHLNDAAADNRAMPNVVIDGDTNLIYDGHHRLVALWLLGADSANCWKIEI